jgi:peptide/nickel transport system ATP-binding protein
MAMPFITHNLGVVAQVADRVAVMYAGQVVEQAGVEAVFARPAHPYTRALFGAIPRMDRPGEPLAAIPGRVPALDAMPPGCRFAPRCPERMPRCDAAPPALLPRDGSLVACYARQDADRAEAA